MRISGGLAKGISLTVPHGDVTRPATDGLRQAVFSSLGARVNGALFLDLFAGSGAYGLEALSRGASSGFFVDKHPRSVACIERNLTAVAKSIGRDPKTMGKITQSDALSWIPPEGQPLVELVFIDPPYELIPSLGPKLLTHVLQCVDPTVDPLVIFETPGEITLTHPAWELVKRLGGKNAHQPGVSVFRRCASPLDPPASGA